MAISTANTLAAALRQGWHRARFFTDIRAILRLMRYRRLREGYYRDFWERAAAGVGAAVEHTPFGFTRITRNGRSTFVRQSLVMLDDHLTLEIMGNKALTYSLIEELGFPVVGHCLFALQSLDQAKAFLASRNKPVVVKPASGTGGGRGVTTGIETGAELAAAARLAARFDSRLLVEEQVEGASFRLLYLDGELIDAIRRDPPSVTGDGRHSIGKLIALENRRRETELPYRAMNPLVVDRDCCNWLRQNGLSLSTVPSKGAIVQVKRAVNENDRSGNVNVAGQVGEEIAEACGELVRALGVKFAGVDLYCRDIGGSFEANNCIIGEINTTPAFHHHDLIANPGEARPVGQIVLRHMLENGVGVVTTVGSRAKRRVGARTTGAGDTAISRRALAAVRTNPRKKETADVS